MKQLLSVLTLAWAAPLAAAQGAFLGVELDAGHESGARVAQVQQPSAASLMGLQTGDIILGLDEHRVTDAAGLVSVVGVFLPGDLVEVRVLRGTDELTLQGILGRRPADRTIYTPQPPQGRGFAWDYSDILPQPWQKGFPSPLGEGRVWVWPPQDGENEAEAWPMPGLPNGLFDWNALPDGSMPFEWDQIQKQFEQLREGALGGMPSFEFQVGPEAPQNGTHSREVTVRYPESTPQEDRQALIDQAIEEYGEGVVVEFKGQSTSISIHQSFQSGSAGGLGVPQPPTPPLPPNKDDDEI